MKAPLLLLVLIVAIIGQERPVPDPGERPVESSFPQPPPREINLPPPPPGPGEFIVSSDVDLVLLDVSVKDPRGGYVSGLEKENFKVFENGKQEIIRIFAKQDAPVTIGLVVDNSGSVRPKRPEIVTSALAFAQESHPQDEFFVVNFNDRVIFGLPEKLPFTDDIDVLRQALLGNPVQGRTALYDGLAAALEHLDKGRRDKKTLILIADGGDNASQLTEDQLIRAALESRATIYTVGIYNPEDKDKNPGFLNKLATITGGEFYQPKSLDELVGIAGKIAKDIRNRYTVGYSPSDSRYDGKLRKIRLIATSEDQRKLQVKTRAQYVATARAARGTRTRMRQP